MIDFSKLTPACEMKGEDSRDTELLFEGLQEAKNYISKFTWCKSIEECYFGLGVGGIVMVFLIKIVPSKSEIDDAIWVIVGDVPPLYLTTEQCENPAKALQEYIWIYEEWVDAAINQYDDDDLPPAGVDKTPENGLNLSKRLKFIEREILEHYK